MLLWKKRRQRIRGGGTLPGCCWPSPGRQPLPPDPEGQEGAAGLQAWAPAMGPRRRIRKPKAPRRRPPAGPILRHFLPSTCSPETSGSEGDPNSSEEHTPVVKEEPLLPPGSRSVSSSSLWGCLSPLLTYRPCHSLPEGCAAGQEDPRRSGRAPLSSCRPWLWIPGTLPVTRTRSTEYKVLPGLAISEQSVRVAFVISFF